MMRTLLLGIIFLGAGCVDLEVNLRDPSLRKDESISPTAISRPITADQVTPANARQMAQALWDEYDREDQARVVTDRKNK